MLLALALCLPLGWLLQGFGNAGMWLAFLSFMLMRSLILGACFWRIERRGGWIRADMCEGATSARCL
ncbi:hypothetical protein D3C85_1764810 [compost metagenome]